LEEAEPPKDKSKKEQHERVLELRKKGLTTKFPPKRRKEKGEW